ncbi:MAG: hypothetical protein ACPW61_04880 [Methyloligella sp. ZOD6]
MFKTFLFAATTLAFVGAVSLSAPANAGPMEGMKKGTDCRKLAKMHYPDDRAMRKEFKKSCKAAVESGDKM